MWQRWRLSAQRLVFRVYRVGVGVGGLQLVLDTLKVAYGKIKAAVTSNWDLT